MLVGAREVVECRYHQAFSQVAAAQPSDAAIKPKRTAESIFSPKVCSCREWKRASSAVVITSAGTASGNRSASGSRRVHDLAILPA
jgi:hypothetical protein